MFPALHAAADGALCLWGTQSGAPTPYPGFDLSIPALNMRTYTMLEIAKDAQRLPPAAAFVQFGKIVVTVEH
ncbi:hypothetical protein GCM10010211_58200 [Streptomyces albospinus]|uniref:Uncharacterized protein n=1 Tax=Streptomyces albospinus TaxID=285515 RepID=A0ABQ2VJ26_9ACTN|nr:hypothetical protein [Streptomyces albospinus]GGU84585.1 hypothetical protein GCM10010211_58200 [Streptomyces albospinus]